GADVVEGGVAEAEAEAVGDTAGGGGVQGQSLGLELRLVGRLDLAGDVCLLRGDGAHPHAVLRSDDDVDRVQVGAAGVLQGGGRPVVVLAHGQGQLGADLLGVDHEGPGADDVGGVAGAELLAAAVQGGAGQQAGVDCGDGLGEARRGRGEVETHRGGVDDLAVVVVVDRLGDGQGAVRIAPAVQVEVLDRVLGEIGRAHV